MVMLWFQSTLTIRSNGGGTGNVRTASGSDRTAAAGSIIVFRTDGGYWQEVGVPPTGSGVTELADSKLAVDTASWDFQSLASGGHLEIFVYARTTVAANTDSINMRLNNDSGGTYYVERLRAIGATVTSTETLAATSFGIGDHPGANATAAKFGASHVFIPHYANTVNHKAISTRYGGAENTNASSILVQVRGGQWASIAGINRVTLLPTSLNILAGSRASVYARSAA